MKIWEVDQNWEERFHSMKAERDELRQRLMDMTTEMCYWQKKWAKLQDALIKMIDIISDDSRRLGEIIDAFRKMEKRCAAGPIPFTHTVQSDDYEALKRLIEEED